MGRFNVRIDEYDVDFDDTRDHAVLRWKEMVLGACESLSSAVDRQTVQEPRNWEAVTEDIQERANGPTCNATTRRILLGIQPLPRTLFNLSDTFTTALAPHDIELNILWGLLFLNIKLSMESPDKLRRTADWLSKLRRAIERFINRYRMCDKKQESTLTIIDFFDHTLTIMCESVKYLRRAPRNDDTVSWQQVEDKIRLHQRELDELIRHLTEIATYSQATMQQQVSNLTFRHSIMPEPEERANFPITMLPFDHNMNFYGRREELAKMDRYLKQEGGSEVLRTFSIYGRRGVGKTEIALEYAYRNPSRFDAIFWIACETSLSLRQSFTSMAIKLNIPGADNKGHHEENLLQVQKWLKVTRKRWLMIFDNADKESETTLRGYWPIGAMGSILITSRQYYNFMKDINRKGETVKPFNEQESYDLLIRLLGDKWTNAKKSGQLKEADIEATRDWAKKLEGLPLSIATAARLITNPQHTPSFNIAESYARFIHSEQNLPARYLADRTSMIHNLDALFDMVFRALTKPARDLLSVLALLAPDETLIELFLPRKQRALDGKLAFAKQESPHLINTTTGEAALTSIVNITPALKAALDELRTANLIRWDHRIISVHRVTQEAMNYYSVEDLQESFQSAVNLVNEAFPKQVHGGTLYEEWKTCQAYITHAMHLSTKFQEYQSPKSNAQLKSSKQFVELLSNAAWYLYESGDYDLGRGVIQVAKQICEEKESNIYSHLCNTQGCNYYDLNRVGDCRRNWELALGIREKLNAEPDRGDIATSLSNLGNLEAATGRYEEALEHYKRAVDIRLAIGDKAALLLGMTYLGIGRCLAYEKDYTEARRYFSQAEQLFVRTVGADKYLMAYCHHAYGKIEFSEQLYTSARRSFENCLSIASAELPMHPITASAYYSLGCAEFAMGNVDPALGFLNKARNIAERRSPARDDGTIARILWKIAMVLRNNPEGTSLAHAHEADQLLARAYDALSALQASGEAGEPRDHYNHDAKFPMTEAEEEAESFDLLVPGLYR